MPRSERKVAGSIEWRHSLGHLIWNSDGSRSWWRNGERGARMQNVTLSSDGWSDETKRARRQMRLSAALDALGAHRVRAAWRDPAPWCTRARVRGGRVRRRWELRQRQQQRCHRGCAPHAARATRRASHTPHEPHARAAHVAHTRRARTRTQARRTRHACRARSAHALCRRKLRQRQQHPCRRGCAPHGARATRAAAHGTHPHAGTHAQPRTRSPSLMVDTAY